MINLTGIFTIGNIDLHRQLKRRKLSPVAIKWGFWHFLKSTLISKATHEVNLEIRVGSGYHILSGLQYMIT